MLWGVWSLGFSHILLKVCENLFYFKRQSWVWVPLEKRQEGSGMLEVPVLGR